MSEDEVSTEAKGSQINLTHPFSQTSLDAPGLAHKTELVLTRIEIESFRFLQSECHNNLKFNKDAQFLTIPPSQQGYHN